MTDRARAGAKQPERFDPARAARLDDPNRFAYLPVADVIALLDMPPAATLIDFGTGTGTYAIEIARTRPDVRVIAFDEQPEMLALLAAKPAARERGNLEIAGPSRIAELSSRAECILAINVLHELGDAALKELTQFFAPGGRAVIVDWNADADRPIGPPNDHVYSVDEAVARVARAGMTVAGVRLFPYHFALTAFASGSVRA